MPVVTVGLMAPGNSSNYSVVFSPIIGNVEPIPGESGGITWTMAGTTGAITAPSGAAISGINIGQGVATANWNGGTPSAGSGGAWTVPNSAPNPTLPFTYGYTVTVTYNGQPYTSTDPEIVNNPPTNNYVDPDIVRSGPGD